MSSLLLSYFKTHIKLVHKYLMLVVVFFFVWLVCFLYFFKQMINKYGACVQFIKLLFVFFFFLRKYLSCSLIGFFCWTIFLKKHCLCP